MCRLRVAEKPLDGHGGEIEDGIVNTDDDDSLEAVIHAKLTGIAQALPAPPQWYEDWSRLGPESSDKHRISVCQAIRASGCLPAEAGFSLVAWQIDALTEKEAKASLHDLDERMRAVEETYQRETGEPWPLDQVPEGYPQYEELLRDYQAAWDQIFVRRLDDCGERGMADLYARDPEAFERRYQAGCRQLREPVVFRRPSAPDDLVAVASCLDPPRTTWSGWRWPGRGSRRRWETPTSSPGSGITATRWAACRSMFAIARPNVPARCWLPPAPNSPRACRRGRARLAVSAWQGNGPFAGNAAGRRTARRASNLPKRWRHRPAARRTLSEDHSAPAFPLWQWRSR